MQDNATRQVPIAIDVDTRREGGPAIWVEWAGAARVLVRLDGVRPYRGTPAAAENVHSPHADGAWAFERTFRLDCAGPARVHVRDVIRVHGDEIDIHRSWWHDEPRVVPGLEFFLAIEVPGEVEEHLLPGCIYDGNRNAAPERLVPRWQPGAPALFEEHKFPTPMVSVTCRGRDGERFAVALLPIPCPVVDGHLPDQWWSLGLDTVEGRTTLLSVSGRLACNGEDERIYDAQNHVSPYADAWVDARPGHVYEKHVRLRLVPAPAPRWAWRAVLRRALAEQPDLSPADAALISRAGLEDAARLKVGYALRRWFDDGGCAGMTWYPARPGPDGALPRVSVEYGWVGMNLRLATCLWRSGRRTGQADLAARADRCVEPWLAACRAALDNGQVVPTHYIAGTGWRDTTGNAEGYARPTAETLFDLADLCVRRRQAGEAKPEWEHMLDRLLAFYDSAERRTADGLLPLAWDANGRPKPGPVVTAGALLVAALAEASRLPGQQARLDAARRLWTPYADTFLGERPRHPCGSALDSCCEDMESGMFLLIAALRLHDAERDAGREPRQLLAAARQAAAWVLTWTYTWDVPLLPGTLLTSAGCPMETRPPAADESGRPRFDDPRTLGPFRTRGLSDVSVQNRHLHVYTACAEILRLANRLDGADAELYRTQARRMLAPVLRTIARPTCRWGMDEDGEQTEQYNHTNYIQHPFDPVCRPRGGIARWFVPWITVWVLSVCLDFLDDISLPETGVPLGGK